MKRKIVLLDRDGVINQKAAEHDYVKNWSEFKFLPGTLDAIALLTEAGYEIYVVSNQRGVARGLMSEADLSSIDELMKKHIAGFGGKITASYYCTHNHENRCRCRKPQIGMLHKAAKEHDFILQDAVFLGDSDSDEETAKAAGCEFYRITDTNSLLWVVKQLIAEGVDTAHYAERVYRAVRTTRYYDRDGVKIPPSAATRWMVNLFQDVKTRDRQVFFIGNGGSSSIASHMAEDYTKCGGIRSFCFTDAALLTCLANDFGYERMFQEAIRRFSKAGDVLVAISSSGESPNIVNAVAEANQGGCRTITLSAFAEKNTLSKMGDIINIHTPTEAGEYGIAECAHPIILHAILDHMAEFTK